MTLLLAAGAASADAPEVYVSAGIGASYTSHGSLGDVDADVDFDIGRPIAGVALGIATAGGWRFELDGNYRFNDTEVVVFGDGSPDLQPDSNSTLTASSASVNAVYEFPGGLGFRPYLGVGIGGARVDYEITEYITGRRLLDDDDSALAYQLTAGFALELTRRLDLLVDYRYWRAPDVHLTAVDGTPADTDYDVHSAMMSLRFSPRRGAGGPVERRSRPGGWYVRAQGGPSFSKDAEIKNNIANFDAFDLGSTTSLALGRTVRERWRLELEGALRRNEVDVIDFNPEFGEERAGGRVSSRSVMANLIYEPGWRTAFQPYAGLGVGAAWSDWDVRIETQDRVYVDDRDDAWAAQVLFGAAARVSDRLELNAEFRYWITGLFHLREPDGRPMHTELSISSVMLGVRYTLP